MKISFQIFDLILRNFISFFWDFNGGSTRKGHLQILVLKSKEKKWWNDESVRPSTLLKLKSTADIFMDQVHKFHNRDFKEYPWKDATVSQKSMYFKNMLWNNAHDSSKSTSIEAHRNTELCFQFPKCRPVMCTVEPLIVATLGDLA